MEELVNNQVIKWCNYISTSNKLLKAAIESFYQINGYFPNNANELQLEVNKHFSKVSVDETDGANPDFW